MTKRRWGSWTSKNLGKLWANGQLSNCICRMRIMIKLWLCFRQANRWSQLSPSGAAPAARSSHTAVWCDMADGMYVFGGWHGRGPSVNSAHAAECAGALHGSRWGYSELNDLHFFDRQAQGGWNLLEVFFGKIPREVWWGLMIWHKSFGWISWRHENVCETSCHRSTCLAPPFFLNIFCGVFTFTPLVGDTCQCRDEGLYAVHVQTWSNMSKSES